MQRFYYCPNCRAPIYDGEMYCGNCGVRLKWVEYQIPPQGPPVSYSCYDPGRQTTWRPQHQQYKRQAGRQEKTGPKPAVQHNKKTAAQDCEQRRRHYADSKQVAVSRKKQVTEDGPAQALLNEVSELLAHLFEKEG